LNNLRIFVDPKYSTNYKLLFNIENTGENEIVFERNYIDIVVESCGNNQITVKDKNNFIYCENPMCLSSCPVGINAECDSFENNTSGINNEKLNKCVCNKGWKGKHCDEKIYVDFR